MGVGDEEGVGVTPGVGVGFRPALPELELEVAAAVPPPESLAGPQFWKISRNSATTVRKLEYLTVRRFTRFPCVSKEIFLYCRGIFESSPN